MRARTTAGPTASDAIGSRYEENPDCAGDRHPVQGHPEHVHQADREQEAGDRGQQDADRGEGQLGAAPPPAAVSTPRVRPTGTETTTATTNEYPASARVAGSRWPITCDTGSPE